MASSPSSKTISSGSETGSEPYPAGLPRLSNAQWGEAHDACLTPNYGPRRLALVRGAGSRVWDADGREYLDFLTGISVNNLGHCHPRVTRAIQEQAGTLVHVSNLYYIPVQIELAKLLTGHSFADRVFFGNSGAEANEAAIKIARRWSYENQGENPNRHHIITMLNSFHGRTFATMAATGQEKIKKNFYPQAQGFSYATFNDTASVERLITEDTCAIMLEPVQGEGGLRAATPEFLGDMRRICDELGLLLIFDEVQCGLGRAGKLFAYENYDVRPDIMTLAKSLGGGMAMGAMLTTARVAGAFGPGAHASTMGGAALTSAAALAYLCELIEGDWPARGAKSGDRLRAGLSEALAGNPNLVEVRGPGMMIGIELRAGGPEAVEACERDGLLINCTAGNTLRLAPPLNVADEDIDCALKILVNVIREVSKA